MGGRTMAFARATIAALAGLMLVAANEPPPLPPQLDAYVEDGRFEPGDYGWARGAFPDAAPEQVEAFAAISQWAEECRTAARDEAVAELAAMGIDAATLSPGYFSLGCHVALPQFDTKRPFAEFEASLREARPIERYGTQWGACEGSVRPLRPLEDEPRLAELREEMGLEPIEDYARAMDRMSGPCGERRG
jgi:hypothetical protein